MRRPNFIILYDKIARLRKPLRATLSVRYMFFYFFCKNNLKKSSQIGEPYLFRNPFTCVYWSTVNKKEKHLTIVPTTKMWPTNAKICLPPKLSLR